MTAVDAGEHHLCVKWQNHAGPSFGHGTNTAAAHLTAEAGGVYFFVARDRFDSHDTPLEVKLVNTDPDEGLLLTEKFSLVTSRPKK